MLELLLHGFPIVFALASFWSNTERKVLLLNLGLCVAVGLLLAFEQAWSGAIVITIAGLSTSYRLIKQKLLSPIATYITLITMLCIVLSVNNLTGKASFIETMPAFTFMAYRFGELYCKEAGASNLYDSGVFEFYTLRCHHRNVGARYYRSIICRIQPVVLPKT